MPHAQKKLLSGFTAAVIALTATTAIGTANAETPVDNESVQNAIEQTKIEQNADLSSTEEVTFEPSISTYSADGLTAAPGASGAYVGINVNGSGLHVDTVYVNYFSGAELENSTVEDMELAWYEGGQRHAETTGPDSGWVRATRKWDFNRSIDAGPMCGRVKVEGQWSNYACVEIKP